MEKSTKINFGICHFGVFFSIDLRFLPTPEKIK
jgi:hypothetical protein